MNILEIKNCKSFLRVFLILTAFSIFLYSCKDEEPLPVKVEICDNGIDDDNDGFIDCQDADCAHLDSICLTEICGNGSDDDLDGFIDCDDLDCEGTVDCPVEICDNAVDDDGDGFTDCDDADCVDFVSCL